MLSLSTGPYRVLLQAEELPSFAATYCRRAALVDTDVHSEGTPFFCAVEDSDSGSPLLVVIGRYDPGLGSGFHPGVALVPETGVLFLGAGKRLAAYELAPPRKLWEDEAELGFTSWAQHGNVVVMSAELELAAWDTRGEKLWTTFVEPPWDYTVQAGTLELDVMGAKRRFPLRTGPTPGDVPTRAAVQEARAVCEAMLTGTLGLVTGLRRLVLLRHQGGSEGLIPEDFNAYVSELDGVPEPGQYALWEPAALQRQLARVEFYRADILESTSTLLERLKGLT